MLALFAAGVMLAVANLLAGFVGLAPGEVERDAGDDNVERNARTGRSEVGEIGGQHAERQHIDRRNTDRSPQSQILACYLAAEGSNLLFDVQGGLAHLLARGNQGIAIRQPLEQPRTKPLFERV